VRGPISPTKASKALKTPCGLDQDVFNGVGLLVWTEMGSLVVEREEEIGFER
jgi:hypothetical protein